MKRRFDINEIIAITFCKRITQDKRLTHQALAKVERYDTEGNLVHVDLEGLVDLEAKAHATAMKRLHTYNNFPKAIQTRVDAILDAKTAN